MKLRLLTLNVPLSWNPLCSVWISSKAVLAIKLYNGFKIPYMILEAYNDGSMIVL